MLLAHADWLAWRWLSKYYSPPSSKTNKMASCFVSISEKEIVSMNEEAVPKNTKMSTKFGVTVFNGKLVNLSSLIF